MTNLNIHLDDDLHQLYGPKHVQEPLLKRFLKSLTSKIGITIMCSLIASLIANLGYIKAIAVWISAAVVALWGPPEASAEMKEHIGGIIGSESKTQQEEQRPAEARPKPLERLKAAAEQAKQKTQKAVVTNAIDPARQKADEVKQEVANAKEELKQSVDSVAGRLGGNIPTLAGRNPERLARVTGMAVPEGIELPQPKTGGPWKRHSSSGITAAQAREYEARRLREEGMARRTAITSYASGFLGIPEPEPKVEFVGPPTPDQAEALKEQEMYEQRAAVIRRKAMREAEGRARLNNFMFGGRR